MAYLFWGIKIILFGLIVSLRKCFFKNRNGQKLKWSKYYVSNFFLLAAVNCTLLEFISNKNKLNFWHHNGQTRINNNIIKHTENGFGSTPSFYDTRKLSEKYFGPAWTIQDFGLMPVEKRPRIDYIFSNKKVRVTHFHNISDQRGDVYPSDHNPQLSTVVF